MPLSSDVVEICKAAGFSMSEVKQLEQGKLLQGVLDSTGEREIAAKVGCVIHAPVEELIEVFMTSNERLDNDPAAYQLGTMTDMSTMSLEPSRAAVIKDYLAVKAGSDLNLSKEEMGEFQALPKGSGPEKVEDVLRGILSRRYEAYVQTGLENIPPYHRKGKDYHPGPELAHKSKMSLLMKNRAPNFYKYLNDYPQGKPEGVKEAFSWVNFTIDDKPTIALVHKFGMMENGAYVFAQRHFYVSRGHNSVQALGGAFPQSDGHTVVLYGSRTSTDRVAGFGGGTKRAMGSRIMGGKVADNLERVRAKRNK